MDYALVYQPASWMSAAFYALPRMLAMFSVLPMLNRQALPGVLRMGVASAFAVFVVPSLLEGAMDFSRSGGSALTLITKEAMIGFILGFFVALPLWALDIVGAYIDNQRGASIAATINPLTGHDTSPLGEMFSQAGMVVLLISGGLLMILELIYLSYLLWPVFAMLPRLSDQTPTIVLGLMDKLMWLAVMLSAPVIFSMFLAEVGLGIVSRFVPQLQVFFLAMPLKLPIAMFVLSVYMAALIGYFSDEYVDAVPRMLALFNSFFTRGER
jgi:type III secretion protein T